MTGLERFDSLGETAQAAISAYYEAQGRLYDADEQLELSFPAGVLFSEEYAWGWGFPYDSSLRSLLQPWAIPET